MKYRNCSFRNRWFIFFAHCFSLRTHHNQGKGRVGKGDELRKTEAVNPPRVGVLFFPSQSKNRRRVKGDRQIGMDEKKEKKKNHSKKDFVEKWRKKE